MDVFNDRNTLANIDTHSHTYFKCGDALIPVLDAECSQ